MDVFNEFQLPPNLANISLGIKLIFILSMLFTMAIVSSIVAYLFNVPKPTVMNSLVAVLINVVFSMMIILNLFNINQPPDQYTLLLILFISATIGYTSCYFLSIMQGITLTGLIFLAFFAIYKCTLIYMQINSPDFYQQYTDTIEDLITEYQDLAASV